MSELQPKMSVKETAGFLGISTPTIHRLLKNKSIPHYRIGRRVLFDPAILNTWLKERLINTATPQ